jgi:HK97 family phage major capsid protein
MEVLQDPYNGASSGEVRFHMWRRVGGLVVLPEAFVLYQLS